MSQKKNDSPNQDHNFVEKQIRFAVVMYGGVSLAIYINGIAQELLKLVQATAKDNRNFPATASVYRKVAFLLSGDEEIKAEISSSLAEIERLKNALKEAADGGKDDLAEEIKRAERALDEKLKDRGTPVKFVIDVLSGTSAGGINAVFLAKALANNLKMDSLKKLWLIEGDIDKLINDDKSVAGTDLTANGETNSLLNGNRMYLKLLEAFKGMDSDPFSARAVNSECFVSPNVEELDLFVTYTDYAGVPLPLRLSDKIVYERRHKQVFNFRYSSIATGNSNPKKACPVNQFAAPFNPFLAFAARCTSAFPFAFEPMKLSGIDQIIQDCLPEYRDGGSNKPDWQFFFRNATKKDGTPVVWNDRYFVDGGYLDNKPFSYAIETLSNRQSVGLVERKLIYIDPFPEIFKQEKDKPDPPDALQNVLAAAMDLPRYETIREDLQRLLDRNRLISRVNRLVADAEKDFEKSFEKSRRLTQARLEAPPERNEKDEKFDWTKIWLDEVIRYKGEAFLPYYRLRVSAVTDDTARLVTRFFKIEDDSDYFSAIRCLVSVWRDRHYCDYKPNVEKGEREKKPFNQFLSEFDVDYRVRRLKFVLQKAEYLLRCSGKILTSLGAVENTEQKASRVEAAESASERQQGLLSPPAALQNALARGQVKPDENEFARVLNWFQGELNLIYRRVLQQRRNLQASAFQDEERERLSFLKPINDALVKLEKNKADAADKSDAELAVQALNRILKEIGKAQSQDCRTGEKNDWQQAVENSYKSEGEQKELFDDALKKAADNLLNFYEENIFLFARAEMAKLLDLNEPSENSREIKKPHFDSPATEIVRAYLRQYYKLFDSYDQISFPIFYESPVGEAVPVDVVRISPHDAKSLIDEEKEAAAESNPRRKLAGDSFYAFGAFLDASWRQNDIMWGRLDGAERLIETLLPGDDAATQLNRTALIREAQEKILCEELLTPTRDALKESFINTLARAKTAATEAGAIDKILAGLDEGVVKQGLNQALQGCLNPDEVCAVVRDRYEVNRKLEPQPFLKAASRSTQVTGKVLESISEKYGQSGSRLNWIAKLGQIFWGLVEVAAPNSAWNLLFVYWLQLVYLFEVIMIVGGTLLVVPQVQQFGIVAFVLTVAVNLTVLALHDSMKGNDFFKLLRILLVFVVAVLVLAGVFAFYAFLYADDTLLTALKELRKWMQKYSDLQKIMPVAALAILVVGLQVWRQVRNRNTRFFGWVICILIALFVIVGTAFFTQNGLTKYGLTNTGLAHVPEFANGLPPILALEFLRDVQTVNEIAPHPDAGKELKRALLVDSFVIVPIYTTLFLLMSQLLALRFRRGLRKNDLISRVRKAALPLSIIAALCAFLGGVADCIENYFSYRALDLSTRELSQNEWLVAPIFAASNTKFVLIFVATIILSLIFLRFRFSQNNNGKRDIVRNFSLTLVGLAFTAAGVLGLIGIAAAQHYLIHPLMLVSFAVTLAGAVTLIIWDRDFFVDY